MADPQATSRGVEALISRLRDDGVEAGRAEAARIRAEAEAEAARVKAAARQEADTYMAEARKETDTYRAAGEEALDTAMRDAILTMKSRLMAQFEADVKRMVSAAMADEAMLKQMILELVGRARRASGAGAGAQVILPAEVVGPDAIRDNPGDIQSGALTRFVLGLTQEMLEEGVTLHAADEFQAGIRARVADGEIELDLSDEAIADLLMKHLQPRFRAVLDGVIR